MGFFFFFWGGGGGVRGKGGVKCAFGITIRAKKNPNINSKSLNKVEYIPLAGQVSAQDKPQSREPTLKTPRDDNCNRDSDPQTTDRHRSTSEKNCGYCQNAAVSIINDLNKTHNTV